MSRAPLGSIPKAPTDADGSACATGGKSCGCPMRVAVPLTLRWVLGGLLVFSGWLKLGISSFGGALSTVDPQSVLFAIKKFEIPVLMDQPEVMAYLAYAVPWVELVAGVALLLGMWTRAAAWIVALTMAAFTAGIVGIVARGLEVDCPCFGSIKFLCPSQIGSCHIVRNVALMIGAIVLARMGYGALGVDGMGRKKWQSGKVAK